MTTETTNSRTQTRVNEWNAASNESDTLIGFLSYHPLSDHLYTYCMDCSTTEVQRFMTPIWEGVDVDITCSECGVPIS